MVKPGILIQKTNDGSVKELYSLNNNPSFELRFDSLYFLVRFWSSLP